MKKAVTYFLSSGLFLFVLFSFGVPKNLQKKVYKEIKNTFKIEDFNLSTIKVDDKLNASLPFKINDENFHQIKSNQKVIGYAIINTAPSKTADFDYLILLDATGTIVKSNVLIYREEYGGEIGSTRWLRQFIGKNQNDILEYKKNIDAISGATISVKSMIKSVNEVLQTVKILKANKIV